MTRYKGKSGHEMIQDSMLFGVERFTFKADKTIAKADRFLGIDPEKTRLQRKERGHARQTLQKMGGWNVPIPSAANYSKSLQNLLSHGFIERRKTKKGFKMTKKGKASMRKMESGFFK